MTFFSFEGDNGGDYYAEARRGWWIISLNEGRYPNVCLAHPSNARRRFLPFIYFAFQFRGRRLGYCNSRGGRWAN